MLLIKKKPAYTDSHSSSSFAINISKQRHYFPQDSSWNTISAWLSTIKSLLHNLQIIACFCSFASVSVSSSKIFAEAHAGKFIASKGGVNRRVQLQAESIFVHVHVLGWLGCKVTILREAVSITSFLEPIFIQQTEKSSH